jgi:hypothetical protein
MDPRWAQSSWGYGVSTPDELTRAISRISTLEGGRRYVWRGMHDCRFEVRSSLIRHLAPPPSDDLPTEDQVRAAEAQVIARAREWRIGLELGNTATDFHILALLQHHQAFTRLIDVTWNPMTALWFACQPASRDRDIAGALLAFDTTDLVQYETVSPPAAPTLGDLENPLGDSLARALDESAQHQRPFVLSPSLPDVRMVVQEGLFLGGVTPQVPAIIGLDSFPLAPGPPLDAGTLKSLFQAGRRGRGRPPRLPFAALVISRALKPRMLRILESTYNRRRDVLFPDLAGFAAALREGTVDIAGA